MRIVYISDTHGYLPEIEGIAFVNASTRPGRGSGVAVEVEKARPG
jgi:hypothetical protein